MTRIVDKDSRPKRRVSMRLAARPDGRFAKVIDGQYHYFGSGGDRDSALKELADFIRLRDRGHAPTVQLSQPSAATVAAVCQAFIDNRNARLAEGALTVGTFDDYRVAVEQFAAAVNAGVLVDDLLPADFARVRAAWSARMGSWALDRHVQAVRTMFRWALKHRTVEREPFYGDRFGKVAASERRRENRATVDNRGHRKFHRDELRRIIDGDKQHNVEQLRGPMLAMVLLGLNGGMYSKDVSDLRRHDLKKEGKIFLIESHRQKTGVPRCCPLWPETRDAIEAVPIACVRHEDDATRVFTTAHGRPWNRNGIDSISMMFARRLAALGIKRPGIGFGTLRHTHVSAVGDHPDLVAARLVRAHKISSIEGHYDTPSVARLLAVTNLARKRLLPSRLPTSTSKVRPGVASAKRDARAKTRAHA